MYCKKGDLIQFVLNPIHRDPDEVPYAFSISKENIRVSQTETLITEHQIGDQKFLVRRNFERFNIVLPVDNDPRDMVTIQPPDEDDDYVDRPESVYVEIVSNREEEYEEPEEEE